MSNTGNKKCPLLAMSNDKLIQIKREQQLTQNADMCLGIFPKPFVCSTFKFYHNPMRWA